MKNQHPSICVEGMTPTSIKMTLASEGLPTAPDHLLCIFFEVYQEYGLNPDEAAADLDYAKFLSSERTRRLQQLREDLPPDVVIPDYADFCAGFLRATIRHISQRTKRAIRFCEKELVFMPDIPRNLVISGGVASNDIIFNAISNMSASKAFKTIRPKKALCNDNGIMIAWNGIEKMAKHQDMTKCYDSIDICSRAILGTNLIQQVKDANIPSKSRFEKT
ncbi:probable tRNA N6-adenosine threonylcarbamoyltransferase, mitochondrial [Topomyia yanbarensis]|uniref:probable tRNA N6-adenosine threonylcarbamoyltransferase, mitochondrial n=1 Tax=Topomyia yanbarensis TaxID=2498891 RepID=UPI00273B3DFC|nr:probable tRNA N6-adenosine threonylcarbamoyltransferase, mitochondrial [Topomyia yanbarensis]